MHTRHMTIEVPWQIARHKISSQVTAALEGIARGTWQVEEIVLNPEGIVDTALRVLRSLRQLKEGEEMRMHVVIQLMRLKASNKAEFRCPLFFMAAADGQGVFTSLAVTNDKELPLTVKKEISATLQRIADIFSRRNGERPFQQEFDDVAAEVEKIIITTNWFDLNLQRFWSSIK